METRRDNVVAVSLPESWVPWPVYWSAIWVGAPAAIALAFFFGLAAAAVSKAPVA